MQNREHRKTILLQGNICICLSNMEGYERLDSHGYTSTIYRLPGQPPRVCKAFNVDCIDTMFPVERAAYQRFAAHEQPRSILQYYGVHETIPAGIILELAPKQDVHAYLWDLKHQHGTSLDSATLYRWAAQAAEALEFAHSVGVFNSDIHCVNLFLDDDLNLKVGDWAGASIDGSRPMCTYRLRHRLFEADGTDVTRTKGVGPSTEIFALGTAIYYMVTVQDPWPDLREGDDQEEIKRKLIEQEFPDTKMLPDLGEVCRRCWHIEFKTMREVKQAIEAERDQRFSTTAAIHLV